MLGLMERNRQLRCVRVVTNGLFLCTAPLLEIIDQRILSLRDGLVYEVDDFLLGVTAGFVVDGLCMGLHGID